MLNYNLNESMIQYDYAETKPKKTKEEEKHQPKKDRTIKIPKLYEF